MADLSAYCPTNLLYTQEKFTRYQPGGYHPVSLGDTFKDGRYEVHHKLGWGGYSTVWLVYDLMQKQWVSLKIMTADRTDHSHELEILQRLARHSGDSLRGLSYYIVQLLDTFFHPGPNGVHQCLVFELLGPSVIHVLKDYYDSGDVLEPETIMRMSEQLLKGVGFIHRAGLGHGDISGANVAFSASHLSKASKEVLLEVIGAPEAEEVTRIDGEPLDQGLPKHLIKAASWVDWIDEDEEDLRILDFGESFLQGKEPTKLAQPGHLRVPETIFTECFDYRVDLWRAGCMIYSFAFAAYPFSYWGSVEALAAQMIGFVEKLPVEWQPQWQRMLSNSGSGLQVNESCSPSRLDERFNTKLPDPALEPLRPVIKGLMRFLPSDRMEASEALDLLRSSVRS
ncbi:kinase-like protein [Aspergillus ibericus CBS 121593]|uniref:Kinase-like protein n=1 Tax=Aspergillus ibericus CBS 121593 TaxID=1448316 RepID=A0A395GWX9_9EURO|nr:kinase-like protein [Aspergillus ibericus CBS 121593]RAK99538.1 kinase-like protein [Aspergillus ibericus CBS 121593]